MSYSGSTSATFGSDQENADVINMIKFGQNDLPEAKEAQELGKQTAIALVNGGVIGKEGVFSVALSGHANPQHVSTVGYVNDWIQVSINLVRPKAPAGG